MGGRGTGSGLQGRAGGFLAGIKNKNARAAFTSINAAYGEKNAKAIYELFKKAPEHVKAAWEKYGDRFKFENMTSGGGFFRPLDNTIHINIDRYTTDTYEKAYEVVFHEAGHAIDKFMGADVQDAHISNNIKLGEMMEREFASNLQAFAASKNLPFDATASLQPGNPLIKAYVGELRGTLTKYEAGNVSDMLEPLTGIDYPLNTGHGMDYWKKSIPSIYHSKRSTEAFAEIMASEVADPTESLGAIKRIFPKTYDLYKQTLTTKLRRKK